MGYKSYGKNNLITVILCDTLRDLVPFVQFKEREEHPWRSVTFGKENHQVCCRLS